ncbi:hypothetical protein [Nonomuraea jiangxiensis]|uniref:Uncharacterized protein n=1 Tax=Nonomuraea jiangxiensis TaxID=633440 RepID=A0A1G9VH25_9ACTN|nr:hypothetical protein [Nonomuraea jiangxiensis]SDM71416.1 hypothetical protein SAMN05421869_15325 [Nonomuraea jiangxiensis]
MLHRIAAQLAETQPDADGALDLSLGDTAKQIAADADITVWEDLRPYGRRDILTTCAQRLATIQHRHPADEPEARAVVVEMIGSPFAVGGNLWVLADKELQQAGRAFEQVKMLPDNVDLSPCATSPTNQHAAKIVGDVDAVSLLANAAILLMVAQVIELNATGGWDQFLQENFLDRGDGQWCSPLLREVGSQRRDGLTVTNSSRGCRIWSSVPVDVCQGPVPALAGMGLWCRGCSVGRLVSLSAAEHLLDEPLRRLLERRAVDRPASSM